MDVDQEARRRMRSEEKSDSSALNNQRCQLSMRALFLHNKRQMEIVMTREDESMNLDHQSQQLLKMKSRH